MKSYFFSGDSPDPQPGPPAESLGLTNPFLLLSPDFTGLSIRSGLIWKNDSATLDLLDRGELPLHPTPKAIIWDSEKSRVDVYYDINKFIQSISPHLTANPAKDKISFDLISFNSVDFGFVWGMLDSTQSTAISGSSDISILYSGFSYDPNGCGLAQGCNRRVNFSKFNGMVVEQLPARAVFKLWIDKPENADSPPNLTYSIHFD